MDQKVLFLGAQRKLRQPKVEQIKRLAATYKIADFDISMVDGELLVAKKRNNDETIGTLVEIVCSVLDITFNEFRGLNSEQKKACDQLFVEFTGLKMLNQAVLIFVNKHREAILEELNSKTGQSIDAPLAIKELKTFLKGEN